MRTVDGGQTWEENYNVPGHYYNDIHFVNTLNGWVVGSSGAVFHTVDGGVT